MITIDEKKSIVTVITSGSECTYPFQSSEAFKIVSAAWLRVGWDNKYPYTFTWLGRPVIQLPEDLVRVQEVIYRIKPDFIVETGVAHGGSLVFYASLCKVMNKGRVIGVDIEIRPHNRNAIEAHELFPYITLVEGSSIDEDVFRKVKSFINPGGIIFVMLDSNHSKDHVLAELNLYSELVSVGSYIVAADGIMENMVGAPRSNSDWSWNNPKSAALEFIKNHKNFIMEEPELAFNESPIAERVTYWPSAYLRRIK